MKQQVEQSASVPSTGQPIRGDIVHVRDWNSDVWVPRIFLERHTDGRMYPITVVRAGSEPDFLSGKPFNWQGFGEIRS